MLVNDHKKGHILFIETGGTSSGGSFRMLYYHLKLMNKQKYNPVVVFINNNNYAESIRKMGIPVYIFTDYLLSGHLNPFLTKIFLKTARFVEVYMPFLYLTFIRVIKALLIYRVCRIVEKYEIDIIHLHTQIQRDLFGIFVVKKMKVPCISHLRSDVSYGFDYTRANFCNEFVTCYLANSKSIKSHWIKLGLADEKSKVIYNGLLLKNVKPTDIRKEWEIGNDVKYIIGCVGRLTREKGHTFLLNAFKHLSETMPDTILMIVGDGLIKKEIELLANELGVREKIIFTGHQLNSLEMIAAFDLLIVPSKSEPFGLVTIEGMQVGTPVIGTNSGGIPEIIEHNKNGLLVEYNDVKGLSAAIKKLLNDEQLQSEVIKTGYKTVNDRFSMVRYVNDLDEIYERILEQKNKASVS